MSDDPLVRLWQDHARPLHWRPWQALSTLEQARYRYLLLFELLMLDLDTEQPTPSWQWRHTHREVLELKAASGHEPAPGHEAER